MDLNHPFFHYSEKSDGLVDQKNLLTILGKITSKQMFLIEFTTYKTPQNNFKFYLHLITRTHFLFIY